MKGFFDTETIIKIKKKKTRRCTGNKVKSNILSCESCGLYETCLSPKMEPTGKNRKRIMILGMVPGGKEDELNTQFIGQAGQTLREPLKRIGYFLDRDFVKDNAVICRTMNEKGNNRNPTNKEINCCRKHVFETIEKYKPKVIIPLGERSKCFLTNSAILSSGILLVPKQ